MLTAQFIGLNLYFAVNLLAALVAFAVFWLIFDAWTVRHSHRELLKWGGFLTLSVGFLLRAATIQTTAHDFGHYAGLVSDVLRFLGYLGIVIGQLLDPLQQRPVYSQPVAPEAPTDAAAAASVESAAAAEPAEPMPAPVASAVPTAPDLPPGTTFRLAPSEPPPVEVLPPAPPEPVHPPAPTDKPKPKAKPKPHPTRRSHGVFVGVAVGFSLPLIAGLASVLYWRRATTGLERHLRPVGWGFAGLGLFELLSRLANLPATNNPVLYRLTAAFGPLWWAALVALLAAALILGNWIWHYLTKRLQSQLFMILVCQTLILFLFSTVGFTFLLMRNIQTQSLADLTTASHVLEYAVTSRQAETTAQAEAVAASTPVAIAVAARDHRALTAALSDYLARHGLTSLTLTDASGQVLLRGEDPERWGDSRSSDPLVRRAVIGETSSSVVVREGVIAPTVTLVAAGPIRNTAGAIVGTVTAGRAISGAFVDGVRSSTGLDSAVYGGNIRAATTLVAPGGNERAIGVKETSAIVNQQVLSKNHSYSGTLSLQNRSYLAAFTPLHDINNVAVGMLLVARPSDALYAAAGTSIQLTFLFVVVLAFLSIYPVYLVSRFLTGQLK